MKDLHYVNLKEKNDRIELIHLLEEMDYKIVDFTKTNIIDSIFPIAINIPNKTISMLGNVTCSAAAASQNLLEDKKTLFINIIKWSILKLYNNEKQISDIKIYTIEEIKNDYSIIPNENGVYFICNLGYSSISFTNNIGNIRNKYKGKNLIYNTDKLKEKYLKGDKSILYIGKAEGKKGLNKRLFDYVEYGYGKNKSHRGGRAIWQINDNKKLGICWLKIDNAKQLETNLIGEYKKNYNTYPISNWRK